MFALLKKYWDSYGGWKAILTSPFIWLSLAITFLSHAFWSEDKWIDMPITMLPSLLGFNLASYSIWLAFGNQKLNRILSKVKKGNSYSKYMEINTSFIHFILVQIICIILSISVKTIDLTTYFNLSNFTCISNALVILNGFIFFLFFYSIFCMFAAILGFIGIASGLDVIYRKEYFFNINKYHEEKEKIAEENLKKLKTIEKLDQELELIKIQKNKANLELEEIKNKLKKRNLFERIKNLIK